MRLEGRMAVRDILNFFPLAECGYRNHDSRVRAWICLHENNTPNVRITIPYPHPHQHRHPQPHPRWNNTSPWPSQVALRSHFVTSPYSYVPGQSSPSDTSALPAAGAITDSEGPEICDPHCHNHPAAPYTPLLSASRSFHFP